MSAGRMNARCETCGGTGLVLHGDSCLDCEHAFIAAEIARIDAQLEVLGAAVDAALEAGLHADDLRALVATCVDGSSNCGSTRSELFERGRRNFDAREARRDRDQVIAELERQFTD